MKSFPLAVSSMASVASALLNMHVAYSDNMINVGNADLFAATWQKIYATDGNSLGVVTDASYGADTGTCQTDNDQDITMRLQMTGAWGSEGDISEYEMRDSIVQTLWAAINSIAEQNMYQVYAGCQGTTWQEGPLYTSDAACGPKSAVSCESACSNVGTPALYVFPNSNRSYLDIRVYHDNTDM